MKKINLMRLFFLLVGVIVFSIGLDAQSKELVKDWTVALEQNDLSISYRFDADCEGVPTLYFLVQNNSAQSQNVAFDFTLSSGDNPAQKMSGNVNVSVNGNAIKKGWCSNPPVPELLHKLSQEYTQPVVLITPK